MNRAIYLSILPKLFVYRGVTSRKKAEKKVIYDHVTRRERVNKYIRNHMKNHQWKTKQFKKILIFARIAKNGKIVLALV